MEEMECSLRNNDITEGCRESVAHGEASQYCKRDEDIDHVASQCGNQELPMQGIVSLQLARSDPRSLSNHSMLTTIEKSYASRTRANDLKSVEISLMMKKMQMKEVQLDLDSDSNFLERCKLSLGISRTSFKVEKFKTQVEETKHGELLKELVDFLVTGLIIMSFCLCCGVYTFSLDNLRELTKSCYPPEGSKSWWKPMASLNLGWQTLSCQVQVYSRIIFGGLIVCKRYSTAKIKQTIIILGQRRSNGITNDDDLQNPPDVTRKLSESACQSYEMNRQEEKWRLYITGMQRNISVVDDNKIGETRWSATEKLEKRSGRQRLNCRGAVVGNGETGDAQWSNEEREVYFVIMESGVLDGKYDDLLEQSFYMVGGIEEVIAKAEKFVRESAA
ncbi:uncharacterized protein LOC141651167 [Silene latifolia]|uniref:uncharacterized protein LOC141651167 n=1 Tax=Silene latifolia TaxID=37657 RepID=UPI003D78689E